MNKTQVILHVSHGILREVNLARPEVYLATLSPTTLYTLPIQNIIFSALERVELVFKKG